MKLFQVGETQVKLHPGLFVVLIGAALFGMLSELLQSFAALTLHELFHVIVARALGYHVDSVELLPFGGVARLGRQTVSSRACFFIAVAGPLCSFVVAGAVSVIMDVFPAISVNLLYFFKINMTIAAFNLLPALPLDGGRMLFAILSRVMRARTATLVAAWLGVALGLGMLALGGALLLMEYAINPFLWVMGVFLLLTAMREMRTLPQAQLQAMMRRRDSLVRGEAVSMRQMAVRFDMRASSALSQLSISRYNLLLVLDDDLMVIGQLDEGRLMAGIAKHGQNVNVGALL